MRILIILLSIVLIPTAIFVALSETAPRPNGVPISADEFLQRQFGGADTPAASSEASAQADLSAADYQQVISQSEPPAPPEPTPLAPPDPTAARIIQKELAVWESLMPRLLEICANGQTPEQARPDEVIKITKCITEVVNANIIPDLAYPELARTMRDRALENSIAYSEGKINNSTYVQRGQENWQRYIEEVEARAQPEPEYEETDPFIKDKIEQYHMASDGIMATVSFEDACRLAHTISAAYLNKKNSKQYAIWKSRESMDCGLASRGMQNSTDLLGAGRHMECSFRGSQHVCYMVDN